MTDYTRTPSGEAEAKAAWKAGVDNLLLSRLDRLDGLGGPTVVNMGETPRLQPSIEYPPVPASSVQQSHSTAEPKPSKLFPAVTAVACGVVVLGLLAWWMGGAA